MPDPPEWNAPGGVADGQGPQPPELLPDPATRLITVANTTTPNR